MNKVIFFCFLQITLLFCLPFSSYSAPTTVFVSIPPLKWLSDQIGKKLITTQILVGKGQNPHTFEPTPKQVIALSHAQLFFSVGMAFEKKISKKLEHISNHPQLIDLSHNVQKISVNKESHKYSNVKHSKYTDKKTDHDHKDLDPHIWLSPINLKIMASTMIKAMIGVDPHNTATYENNLQELIIKLEQLHSNIQKELSPYKGRSIFVLHPSFGYFTKVYQLQQKTFITGGKQPTPKQFISLITLAKSSGVKVLFTQPQFDPKTANAIANAINGRIISINPLMEDIATNLHGMSSRIKEAMIEWTYVHF